MTRVVDKAWDPAGFGRDPTSALHRRTGIMVLAAIAHYSVYQSKEALHVLGVLAALKCSSAPCCHIIIVDEAC